MIEKPLTIKRFELEALRVNALLQDGVLEMPSVIGIEDSELDLRTSYYRDLANVTFQAKGKDIHIIDSGEASCLGLSELLTKRKIENIIAVDERTTRLLGEKPDNIRELMKRKLHTEISSKKENYKFFKGFRFIRSTELMYVAWKKGLIDVKGNGVVLDALLYALMFKGASINPDEIREIKGMK